MTHTRTDKRRGNVVVLALFLMMVMAGIVAFAVDLGYICNVQTELQRSADSAAMAAAWRLLETQADVTTPFEPSEITGRVRTTAGEYAAANVVSQSAPALGEGDVTVGNLPYGATTIDATPTLFFNAVRVQVNRNSEQNGEVPLLFARVLGTDRASLQGEATAAFWSSFSGFTMPQDGSSLHFLPIALDDVSWIDVMDQLSNGGGQDLYTYNDDGTISSGPDGIPEVNLYPQGTGSPGNRGTVDIGDSNNATPDLIRQIRFGVSESDLAHHGGKLVLDDNGELFLNGDTGISAAIKTALDEVKGRPNIIPIFSEVNGNGNNAMYTVTGFGGVRIMNVRLTGKMSSKQVIVQPATVQTRGGIIQTSGTPVTNYIFSPVVLVK